MMPRSYRSISSRPTILQITTCLLGLGLSAVAAAGPKPETPLEQVFYDIGVIGYCGLSGNTVTEGFQREVRRIVEREEINKKAFNAARSRAITLVELEWDNRGLGGFRRWCRTEGETAVRRFLSVPE